MKIDIPSTKEYEKCLDEATEGNLYIESAKWFKTVLYKLWAKMNNLLVPLLARKFNERTIERISNTIRDLIVGIITLIFGTIFGILCNPMWWKFAIDTCIDAFKAEDSYLKGAFAFGQKFVAVLLSTLVKVIEKILEVNNMTLDPSENAKLEDVIGGCVNVATLKLRNQQKQIKK